MLLMLKSDARLKVYFLGKWCFMLTRQYMNDLINSRLDKGLRRNNVDDTSNLQQKRIVNKAD